VQTVGAAVPLFAPPRSHAVSHEEPVRFPIDGGALHAHAWWLSTRAPAAFVLHGIAGSKESYCCVRAGVALHRAGYHVVRADMRGAGESVEDAPSLYHAGLTSDLDAAVRSLVRDPRVDGVVLLGFSGGGSQLLKLAGQWAASAPDGVRALATLSAPLDYTRVAARMDTFACLPYRFHVLRGLLERARAFVKRHPGRAHYRARDLETIRRFRHYDGRIIVPMHGFEDVDAYYWDASAGRWLDRIAIPTQIVHAEDDPMVPIASVRPWLDRASSAVRVRMSHHGGHLGWLGGLTEASWIKSWATSEALAFFAEHAPPAFVRDVAS
jgi:uncharacterized protein